MDAHDVLPFQNELALADVEEPELEPEAPAADEARPAWHEETGAPVEARLEDLRRAQQFIELIKNPRYNFWSHGFTRVAPEIERLFESVARSCMHNAPQATKAADE